MLLADKMAHGSQHQWLYLNHVDEGYCLSQISLLVALSECKQKKVAVQIKAPVVKDSELLI